MNDQPSHLQKIREESKHLQSAVRKQMAGYILGAFGLVAGLAWNEAIKTSIAHIFPSSSESLVAQFAYALILTIVVSIFAYYISKILIREEK